MGETDRSRGIPEDVDARLRMMKKLRRPAKQTLA